MGVIRVKFKDDGQPGARFDRIDPAGFRILGALDRVVRPQLYDLTVTCGSDSHQASDPHTLGRAYDVRSKNLTSDQKLFVLREVMLDLQHPDDLGDAPIATSIGLATKHFYGQLENPGSPNEHLHFQQRKGTSYP